VPLAWLALAMLGSVVVARSMLSARAAGAAAALAGRPRTRLQGLVLLSLLAVMAAVFSVSAALFLATAFATLLLWVATLRGAEGAAAALDHASALGGALLLVLVPLELVLRLPVVSRQFGLPAERERQEASYDRLWERNIFHLRSPYERVARRPGIHRVLALGDSFTWGLYVTNSDSTWPALLERRLGDSVEVINMGQRGWTTFNEAEFLSRLGWQFDPDLVLVQFYINDAYESRPNLGYEEGHRVYLLPRQFWQGYIQNSAFSALVSKAVNGLILGLLFRESDNTARYTDASPGWRQMRLAFRQMADSARARGTPIVLVLFPDLMPGEWTAATYPSRAIHEQVATEARRAGFTVLDLTERFAREGGDWRRWWATPYDAHPNTAAFLVTADAIAQYVDSSQVLRTKVAGLGSAAR
jgi:lysophospholipase L1-like esterase